MTDIELLMITQLVSKDRGSFDSQKYQQNLVEKDISKETWLLPERKFAKAQNNKKIEWHGIIRERLLMLQFGCYECFELQPLRLLAAPLNSTQCRNTG